MRINVSLVAMCSRMSTNHSILRFQKSPFSSFSGRISPGLTGANPFWQILPCRCSRTSNNVFLSTISAAKNPNPRRKMQPDKNWLKAKDSLKKTGLSTTEPSILSEVLRSEEDLELTERQAIGVVVAAQANFMRVIVKKAGGEEESEKENDHDMGKLGFKGNGAPERLHGNLMDSGKEDSGENPHSNGQTVNGVMGTSRGISDDDDNIRVIGNNVRVDDDDGHSRVSMSVSSLGIERVNGTPEVNGNLDGYAKMEDKAAVGDSPEGQRREDDGDNNNDHRGTENFSAKESLDKMKAGTELLCWVRALLKKIKRRVLVGDKVLVGGIDWADKRGMIEDVFERKSELPDPPVANVDHLVVLFSMEQPKLEPFTLTRFLVEAESVEIPFTLALNKAELVQEEVLHKWKDRLQTWGYEPLFCSADTNLGLKSIANVLEGRTSVIVGPSGVGKSSLINALRRDLDISATSEMDLFAGQLWEGSKWIEELRVGEISTRSGRGKHTTRNLTLLPLPSGGYLTDTPGFSQPSLAKVTKNSLGLMFPEIRQMLNSSDSGRCHFRDCLHVGEPGCAVKADWERYPYYLQLLDEIKIREEVQLRLIGTKRESDVRYKVREMGVKQAEPRLEPKKHRRLSRKRINQSIDEELRKELEDYED